MKPPKGWRSTIAQGDGAVEVEVADGQLLLGALLFGFALPRLGEPARPVVNLLHEIARVFFGIVGMVTRVAPVAAFGAMAFTLGKYGLGSLLSLGKLMLCVYLTCGLFVFGVLGLIARLLACIKEELLIVLGTSPSERVLPRMMQRMEELGCARPVVGIVLPAGYSFNLDGTSIYLTLAATLASVSHVPTAGLAQLIGVDRFMSEARALTNLCGNAVAMVVVAMWEGTFDRDEGGGHPAQAGRTQCAGGGREQLNKPSVTDLGLREPT